MPGVPAFQRGNHIFGDPTGDSLLQETADPWNRDVLLGGPSQASLGDAVAKRERAGFPTGETRYLKAIHQVSFPWHQDGKVRQHAQACRGGRGCHWFFTAAKPSKSGLRQPKTVALPLPASAGGFRESRDIDKYDCRYRKIMRERPVFSMFNQQIENRIRQITGERFDMLDDFFDLCYQFGQTALDIRGAKSPPVCCCNPCDSRCCRIGSTSSK